MTTKIISNTIITTGYTLSSAYGALSITSTGTIDGAAGAAGSGGMYGGPGLLSTHGAAVYNAGSITGGQGGTSHGVDWQGGAGGYGVYLKGGSLNNSAAIAGGLGGGATGTGDATGMGGIGVKLGGPGMLINSGTIVGGASGNGQTAGIGTGQGGIGVLVEVVETYQPISTLNNSGLIAGGAGGSGASAASGPGRSGGWGGPGAVIGRCTLTNAGTIVGGQGGAGGASGSGAGGAGGRGVEGVFLTNLVMLTNTGAIIGGAGGAGGAGAVAGANGVGGDGVAVEGSSIVNAGIILGGAGGAGPGQAGVAGDGVKFYGYGALVNQVGGLISGGFGVTVHAALQKSNRVTVTNFGTIEGTGGVAVQFLSAEDRLIAESGSTWIGSVQGAGGALELASGTGTIAGLGATGTVSGAEAMTFSGFGSYILGGGSAWTLTGASTLQASQTLVLDTSAMMTVATGALTVSGTITQSGTITVGGGGAANVTILKMGVCNLGFGVIANGAASGSTITVNGALIKNAGTGVGSVGVVTYDHGVIEAAIGKLDFTKALFGTGSLRIDAGATLEADSTVVSTLTATFNGSSATLALAAPKSFAATISGFAATDTIDLVHIKATGASIDGSDQLVIVNGATTVASLQLTGSYSGATFSIAADGKGGTDITLTSAASAPPSPHQLAAAMAAMAPAVGVAVMAHDVIATHPPMLSRPGTQFA